MYTGRITVVLIGSFEKYNKKCRSLQFSFKALMPFGKITQNIEMSRNLLLSTTASNN